MSFLCSSTPSTSRPLASKVASRRIVPILCTVDAYNATGTRYQHKSYVQSTAQGRAAQGRAVNGLGAWFIKSLAQAGYCSKHAPKLLQASTIFASPRNDVSTRIRHKHTLASRYFRLGSERQGDSNAQEGDQSLVNEPEPNRTKEELLALVDQYSGTSFTDQLPVIELPSLYQPSDGPYLTVSDKAEDEWPPEHGTWPADTETKLKLQELDLALLDRHKGPEEIYQIYRRLPGPRVAYLEAKTRHKMLHHLAVVEHKDEQSMMRYLSVVDDMEITAIPLTTSEWTSAISFVARYVSRATDLEVEAALHMWREMESVAGVKSTGATFNVLFDVACKAGKFNLAEMIYREMEKRGHHFNRFHHVSMIQYHGLQRNGDGARAAYRALVNAGEIVDTVVLNAMTSALIQACEVPAAENIYRRMKQSFLDRVGVALPARDYKSRRIITKSLRRMAMSSKGNLSRKSKMQRRTFFAPDLQTYRILVNHFAVQAGDLEKAIMYLNEMKIFGLPVHGAFFLALFKGFAMHGGTRYTQWTEVRLENVWRSLLDALDDQVEDLYTSKWLVTWALRAFARCSGHSRTLDAWEEIKKKWNPTDDDLNFVMSNLRPLLEGPNMAKQRHDWVLGTGYL